MILVIRNLYRSSRYRILYIHFCVSIKNLQQIVTLSANILFMMQPVERMSVESISSYTRTHPYGMDKVTGGC